MSVALGPDVPGSMCKSFSCVVLQFAAKCERQDGTVAQEPFSEAG
jgi:hypothetical protein